MIEKKHIIIGLVLFALLTIAAAAAQKPLTKEQSTVALTLLGEARGEGEAGMYAVACVIQKRTKERSLSLSQVCQENDGKVWQFSCWKDKPYMGTMGRLLKAKTKQAQYASQIARAITNGHELQQSFTGDANHFYSHKVMKRPPSWTKGFKPTKIIGNHTFYKLPWATK